MRKTLAWVYGVRGYVGVRVYVCVCVHWVWHVRNTNDESTIPKWKFVLLDQVAGVFFALASIQDQSGIF